MNTLSKGKILFIVITLCFFLGIILSTNLKQNVGYFVQDNSNKRIEKSINLFSQKEFDKANQLAEFHEISEYIVTNYDIENAEKFFLPLISNSTDLISKHSKLFLSRMYMERKMYDKAQALLSGINNACSYQALGVLYAEMNSYDKALENYKKSADENTQDENTQFTASIKCYIYGDYECALEYINKSIKLKPNTVIFQEFKGLILLSLNNKEESKKILTVIQDRDDTFSIETSLGHIAIQDKKYDVTLQYFNQSNNKIYSLNLDEYESQNSVFSVGLYRDLLIKRNNLGIGWVYANQNLHQKAITHFDNVLRTDKNNLLAVISKVNSMLALGQNDEASLLLDQAIKIYPKNIYLIEAQGLVNYNKGQLDNAKENFRKALSLNNVTYTCPYEGLGMVFYLTGDFDKAKTNLIKSIEINPDIEYKKYNTLAKIYIKEGRNNEAAELLKKSIENYPFDNESIELLAKIS